MKKAVAVLGVLATISGVFFPVASSRGWWPFTQPSPQLEIVDALVDDASGYTTLDVWVKNIGAQTAVLTGAKFNVAKVWRLTPTHRPTSILLPSAEYDVMLKINGLETYSDSIRISHEVRPNEGDRFTFTLANDASAWDDVVLQMTLELVSGNNKLGTSPPLLFVASKAGGNYRWATSETKAIAQEIQNTEGTKSERLRQLISKIMEAPLEKSTKEIEENLPSPLGPTIPLEKIPGGPAR